MNFERGTDQSGNSWFAIERGVDAPVVGMAVPIEDWPVDAAAQQPLLSQVWALQASRVFSASNLGHAVNPLFSQDFVGISMQLDPQVAKIAPDIVALLAESAWVMPRPLIANARARAVNQLHAHRQDIEAIRRFSPSWHRYAVTLERRLEMIHADAIEEAVARMVLSPKMISTVDSGTLVPELCEVTAERESPIIEFQANSIPEYHISSLNADQQVRVSALMPGVPLASSAKYDLHVAWLLLRSREGVLYRKLRKHGPIAYKVAAFSREYSDAGYGVMSLMCDMRMIPKVKHIFEGALTEMHVGLRSSEVTWAIRELGLQHGLAMRDPVQLARTTLSHMVAGSNVADYPSGIASVTTESLSTAMEMVVSASA